MYVTIHSSGKHTCKSIKQNGEICGKNASIRGTNGWYCGVHFKAIHHNSTFSPVTDTIQCSGTTQKGMQCRRKGEANVGQNYYCRYHAL